MSLKSQLYILFFSIGIFIIILFDFIFYKSVKNTLIRQIHHHLESVAEMQKGRLQRLIINNKERLAFVANRPFLTTNVNEYLQKNDYRKQSILNQSLKRTEQGIESFKDLYITDLKGRVFASSDTSYIGYDFSNLDGFKKALKREYSLDGVHLRKENDLGIFLTAPLFYENKFIAILIIDSYGENFKKAIQDYTGLGKTGETIVIKRSENGDGIYLTPLRFDTMAALRKTIPARSYSEDGDFFSRSEGLYKKAKDYRGENVIAFKKFIPETNWHVITKIDESEATEPIKETRNLLFGISFAAGLILFLSTWIFGNYLTRPIKSLIDYAQKLKEENYSERINDCPNNEIKILGESYNQLADKLQHSQKEIEKTLSKLHDSNEALNNFAYTISHDLKSPLATIEGLVNLIEIDDTRVLPAKDQQIIEMIKVKTKLMGEMISQVLEYSKIGTSESLEKNKINSYEIVREVISNINPPENFQFIIQPGLPEISYPKIPFIQIIQNLISNSIKYMDKPEGIVKISCKTEIDYWRFCVTDNGRGIEEKHFDKIFLMLKKITRENIESTGIGLATVKKIVNENGGRIWVESKVGIGSIFYFTIPKS